MNTNGSLRSACLLSAVIFTSSCATTVAIPVTVAAGKADLGMERISVYPVKDSQNRQENPMVTAELASLFVNAEVKGEKKFDVRAKRGLGDIQEQKRIEQQVLRGSFEQSTVKALKAKGVQGLVFATYQETVSNESSQQKRNKKTVNCVTRTVKTMLAPKIVNASDARIVLQDTYTGSGSKTACGGGSLSGVNGVLASQARKEAFEALRRDIAPYTRNMDATILTNYCDGGIGNMTGVLLKGSACDRSGPSDEVKELVVGGSKFAKQGSLDVACERWSRAAALHSEGFIMPYLLGVCAEVGENNLVKAENLYRQAQEQTTQPVKVIAEALTRIETKTAGKELRARNKPRPVRQADPVVKSVQQALLDAGYEPGPVDGFMGAKTAEALQFFQEDYGLNVSGAIDEATKQELGLADI